MKILSDKKELKNYFESKSIFSTPMVKGMIIIILAIYFLQFLLQ